ncbi:hypothetical protein CSAL01_06657 [Colletotrichum salicis]|uniref:Berberine/berberine-like domain-containing protein n=1 Tax=Colletotrichum salicis TaxID=1209931 RepID=A0A135T1T3_9PEZI|nr:hypothetical protein CSAL01_06657 [Colletotrichum salicis]
MLHINAVTDEASVQKISVEWADSVVNAINSTGESIGPTYVSFMESTDRAEDCYGSNWTRLRDAKTSVDPQDVFRYSHGRIPIQ